MASVAERAEVEKLGIADLVRHMKNSNPSEASIFCEELIRRFEPLTRRVWQRLFRIVDYDDFVQQVFVQVFTGLAHLEDGNAFPGYFRRVVLSVCADFYRKQSGRMQTEVNMEEIPSRVDGEILAGIFVRAYLEQLPPRDAEVLMWEFVWGWSSAEIAVHLGVTAGAVRTIKSRAMRKLRDILLKQ